MYSGAQTPFMLTLRAWREDAFRAEMIGVSLWFKLAAHDRAIALIPTIVKRLNGLGLKTTRPLTWADIWRLNDREVEYKDLLKCAALGRAVGSDYQLALRELNEAIAATLACADESDLDMRQRRKDALVRDGLDVETKHAAACLMRRRVEVWAVLDMCGVDKLLG